MAKGHHEVYYFTGGIPEWRFFNYPMTVGEEWQKIKVNIIPPKQFQQILEHDKDIFLLDVRSLDKKSLLSGAVTFKLDNSTLSGNYIKGVLHCPLVSLEENFHLLPKNRKIIITDWIMKQSTIAAKFLTKQGFEVVGILKGGTARWEAEGLPVIHGDNSLHNELLCD